MKELEDICKIRVKFHEIDSMRVAWHGSYVSYLEDGRESFGLHYPGVGYKDMQEAGIYAPIYDMHLKYFASLQINDIAVIHTHYVYHRGARLDFKYEIYRERDNLLCVKASTVQLFTDQQGDLMLDLPDYYKEWQTRNLGIHFDE